MNPAPLRQSGKSIPAGGTLMLRCRSKNAVTSAILAAALLVGVVSCSSDSEGGLGAANASIHAPFGANATVYAVKDGSPLILINMAPELATLRTLNTADQEEYVLRRALVNLFDASLSHPPYKSMEHFTIRMLLVMGTDEYGRGQWASALELALLEVDRAKLATRTSADLDGLTSDEVRALFASRKVQVANVAKVGK
jgi:hypothetical protein